MRSRSQLALIVHKHWLSLMLPIEIKQIKNIFHLLFVFVLCDPQNKKRLKNTSRENNFLLSASNDHYALINLTVGECKNESCSIWNKSTHLDQ